MICLQTRSARFSVEQKTGGCLGPKKRHRRYICEEAPRMDVRSNTMAGVSTLRAEVMKREEEVGGEASMVP